MPWVDVPRLQGWIGSPGPWSDADREVQALVVDAVNDYVRTVRPDLIEPVALRRWGAFGEEYGDEYNKSLDGPADRIQWAALQLALRWYEKRAPAEGAGFDELGGFQPVDRDIEAALGIGRHHRPVVA